MKIRTLLPLITLILVTSIVAVSGKTALEALATKREAEAFSKVNSISSLLIKSTGELAIERGATAAALSSATAPAPKLIDQMAQHRRVGTEALSNALLGIRGDLVSKFDYAQADSVRESLELVESLRTRIDNKVKAGLQSPSAPTAAEWTTAITGLIGGVNEMRQRMETILPPPKSKTYQLVTMRHFVAEMAERAGRERARLTQIIAARRPIQTTDSAFLDTGRGYTDMAWANIASIRSRADVPPELTSAIQNVQTNYFGTYQSLRNEIMAARETGAYQIDGNDYFEQATVAIGSILELSSVLGKIADANVAQTEQTCSRDLQISIAVLAFSLLLGAASLWIILRRIASPLATMTVAMSELAAGNKTVEILGISRADELGAMASAVQVFKDNAIEMDRIRAEQEAMQEAAKIEKRQAMLNMAASFETNIKGIVDGVSLAASELQLTAKSLTTAAEQTRSQSTNAAAASEQTSASVQAVAAATEELSSSITEISVQINDASDISQKAASEGRGANQAMQQLSDTVRKIGEVAQLISEIAGQTNLLALNATIEAARAGDAGKGFAVVASEVKALANQTAKATEDISAQIIAIQSQTNETAGAIDGICATLDRVTEVSAAVAAAAEEQTSATNEISRNVQQAAAGTSEVSASISLATKTAQDTGAASIQLLSSASNLAKQAETLKTGVESFLKEIRQA